MDIEHFLHKKAAYTDVLLRPKVPKVALIAMQRPTTRCTRLANCLIVLARLRTSAVTTALLKKQADL